MSRGSWSEQDFAGLSSLTVAAHELKSPITLMRQLALALGNGELTDGERRSYSDRLVLMADRSLRLTSELAQASNLQPSLFPLEPTNPMSVCQSLNSYVGALAKMYGRSIIWPTGHKVRLVSANRQLLSSIIGNFIDNAFRYSQDDRPISVSFSEKQGRVRISVRDFGPRMSLVEYRRLVDEMES
ncbi:hypothetical protein B7Z28_01905, partial [Candidatus Saccharibacteria bacterium 32-45-3]